MKPKRNRVTQKPSYPKLWDLVGSSNRYLPDARVTISNGKADQWNALFTTKTQVA